MRLIDADALHTGLVKMNDFGELSAKKAIRMVSKAPTVDAEPVRHGEWVIRKHAHMSGGYTEEKVHCSICDWCAFKSSNLGARIILDEEFKYCPHCGAKMDGERKEE